METPNPSVLIDPIDPNPPPIAPHTPGGAHEGLQLADPLPEDEVSAGSPYQPYGVNHHPIEPYGVNLMGSTTTLPTPWGQPPPNQSL